MWWKEFSQNLQTFFEWYQNNMWENFIITINKRGVAVPALPVLRSLVVHKIWNFFCNFLSKPSRVILSPILHQIVHKIWIFPSVTPYLCLLEWFWDHFWIVHKIWKLFSVTPYVSLVGPFSDHFWIIRKISKLGFCKFLSKPRRAILRSFLDST